MDLFLPDRSASERPAAAPEKRSEARGSALPASELYRRCDISRFEFQTTEQIGDGEDPVGQGSAVEAEKFRERRG